MGRIDKIVKGRDGVIRGADVRTCKGKVSRPLQKMYPLEIEEIEESKITEEKMEQAEVVLPRRQKYLSTQKSETSSANVHSMKDPTEEWKSGGNNEETQSAISSVLNEKDGTKSKLRRAAAIQGEEKRRIEQCSTGGKYKKYDNENKGQKCQTR